MERITALAEHLSQTPLLPVALTLLAYQLGLMLFQKLKRPAWLPPIVAGSLLLVPMIALLLDYATYYSGAKWISFLLGPATVALAVPLFLQFRHIRELFVPIAVTLCVGAPLAAGLALGIAWLLGADLAVLASLAPKSVTAPIAVSLTEQLGGVVPLAVGIVALTGVLCSLFAPLCCRWLKIEDERILGFVMGLNGHGIATARAFELGHQAGAFSSLAMGLTGAFTALLLPLAWALLA
ncbi:LrgB family protein [Motiliproteus sp. SC1-56]|uniref:LrgB family protein n=1 Tax=Motiliproteus sp. SC1-56 TaxID=2799565 RepID=UPI001A901A1A|nr:LrgB family protein [Motiliproteus sp. SC1-56]